MNQLVASHIAGGEIYYDYLGGNNYRITLKVYRDCYNGIPPLDGIPDASNTIVDPTLTVFDGSGNYVLQIVLPPPVVTSIPASINNGCITPPGTVCLEEGVYTTTVSLPARVGGYDISYQSCCRSGATINIVTPGSVGVTYYMHIPGPEVTSVNSSPRFTHLPPVFVCNGLPMKLNQAATDPDGDSLVYSLCAPFQGLDPCCGTIPIGGANPTVTPCSSNCPPLNNPPFTPVSFLAPYSGSYPLSSSPAININPSTGFLNGTPNINGQWVVGICVSEYRHGVLLETHYRDYMFSVVDCIIPVESIIPPQSQLQASSRVCGGFTINFQNQSVGGTKYHWDFGVNSLSNDTSNLVTPSYTYPDTGRYVVTLIVNPGQLCQDTSQQVFYIYPALAPTFTAPPPQCVTNNSFSFHVGGLYAPYASFSWYFGPNVSPPVSYAQNPANVSYLMPGKFPVTVVVSQAICSDTLVDTVKVFPKPVIKFDSTGYSVCDRTAITFHNITPANFPTSYLWKFSDGSVSTFQNPTHTFSPVGIYSVSVMVITHAGCTDTALINLPGFIKVNPSPVAGFSFLPDSTTIFDPDIYFFDESSGATTWSYSFGDGNSSPMVNPSNHYMNYGNFNVTQTVNNDFNCPDAITKTVRILPEFRFWVPNCFTPGNKDGLNDVFLPIVYGTEDYNFAIYNRWGEQIFKTTDPAQGWDGKIRGSLCEQDVYSWVISFKNVVSLLLEQHYGSFTLLK
ncbi:MAG: PKD domain-containing protein [Bacteroidia bacterium]